MISRLVQDSCTGLLTMCHRRNSQRPKVCYHC